MEYLKEKAGLIANSENGLIEGEHERFKRECIGRSYFTGLVIGPLTFSGVYFVQNKLTNNFKVSQYDISLLLTSGSYKSQFKNGKVLSYVYLFLQGQRKGLNLITSAIFGIMAFYLTQKQMVSSLIN